MLVEQNKFVFLKFHYLEIVKNGLTKYQFIKSPKEYSQHCSSPYFRELNTGWKALTWFEHNQIYYSCLRNAETGAGTLDVIAFRDMKLKSCLKSWDFQENGVDVPLTADVIDRLNSDVASELLSGFERVTEVGVNELKNLEYSAQSFLEGKKTINPIPPIIFEFYIVKSLGCTFEWVRNLTINDFFKVLKLCLVFDGTERKWESELATAGMGKKLT